MMKDRNLLFSDSCAARILTLKEKLMKERIKRYEESFWERGRREWLGCGRDSCSNIPCPDWWSCQYPLQYLPNSGNSGMSSGTDLQYDLGIVSSYMGSKFVSVVNFINSVSYLALLNKLFSFKPTRYSCWSLWQNSDRVICHIHVCPFAMAKTSSTNLKGSGHGGDHCVFLKLKWIQSRHYQLSTQFQVSIFSFLPGTNFV